MDTELHHLFHEHPLILIAEDTKPNDGSNIEIKCNGCLTPILGPFYHCRECRYLLHKVCAELPDVLDTPMHPQHPLTLLTKHPASYSRGCYCDVCEKTCDGFLYHCSICKFDVDTICAAASYTIKDKCHMHPLTPTQTPSSFLCLICHKKSESVSYKCTICPFWVHQSCTVLPNTVRHSAHPHLLKLLPSVISEHRNHCTYCDICHDKLSSSYGSYSCVGCLFFAHIRCARDQDIEVNQDSGQRLLLPMQPKSMELISRFVSNYTGYDAKMDNKVNYCEVQSSDTNIDNKFNHFNHDHPLFLIDDQMNEKTCDACAILVSLPSYGCNECDYNLHKCCTELPKHILHASHPEHQLTLEGTFGGFFTCSCCFQICNGFSYRCSERENFKIDIKCASLLGPVYHEAHKHPVSPKSLSFITCRACGIPRSTYSLQCDICSFILCFVCAMAPRVMKHRFGKSHPFVLTYYPPENHFNEYICEICEGVLNPKEWFYHCVYADQFTHVFCMIRSGADSNIKYGKSYIVSFHEHNLTMTSCTYDSSRCNYCRQPLRTGFGAGYECISCDFRIHSECVYAMNEEHKRSANVTISN